MVYVQDTWYITRQPESPQSPHPRFLARPSLQQRVAQEKVQLWRGERWLFWRVQQQVLGEETLLWMGMRQLQNRLERRVKVEVGGVWGRQGAPWCLSFHSLRACLGLAQKILILSWYRFLSAHNKSKPRHSGNITKTNIAIKFEQKGIQATKFARQYRYPSIQYSRARE